jgi:hypothetical protein
MTGVKNVVSVRLLHLEVAAIKAPYGTAAEHDDAPLSGSGFQFGRCDREHCNRLNLACPTNRKPAYG